MTDKQFKRKLNKIKKRGERMKQEYELKEMYSQYVPEKKKRKVSNIVLTIVVVAILAYTIASFWLTYAVGVSIDSTLTTCFYTFMGSELFILAGIKTSKIIKENKEVPYVEPDDEIPI